MIKRAESINSLEDPIAFYLIVEPEILEEKNDKISSNTVILIRFNSLIKVLKHRIIMLN